jgi:hypothetical protein
MPNRIIKESIAQSEKLNSLTDFQFRLWVHLITYVDDYGRGDARPAIIRGTCFPFRERMTNKDIEKGLAELAGAGCVGLYEVDGRPYLYFPGWERHQRVRQKISKFPGPIDQHMEEEAKSARESDACGDVPQPAADGGDVRLESRIQNPESRIQNPESEKKPRGGAERDWQQEFDRFWAAYPRKAGDKKKAFQAYKKAGVELQVLLDAISRQKQSAQWQKAEYIPHPATWLNGRRWEDELTPAGGVPKGASGVLGAAELDAIRRVLSE